MTTLTELYFDALASGRLLLCGCSKDGSILCEEHRPKTDPRDPDYTRTGIFVHHNCWKCQSGKKPCVKGSPNRCDYPHARND